MTHDCRESHDPACPECVRHDETRGPVCQDCGAAIHDGNTCVECWRDRRELALARDRDWWSA